MKSGCLHCLIYLNHCSLCHNYSFLIINKPDKINRNTVTLGTRSGGLNMINDNDDDDDGLFIKSLKATWLQRYLTQNKPDY